MRHVIVSYLFSTIWVVQGDFALTQTQMATYEHNFNDSSCVSTNTITPMSPSDIIVGLYNDNH